MQCLIVTMKNLENLIKINYIGGKLSNKNRGGYGTTGVE